MSAHPHPAATAHDAASGGFAHDLDAFAHDHVYLGRGHARNERRTRWVIALTSVMMVAEIIAGNVFHSMALTADGWHMASHAGAMLIAAAAYSYARRHAENPAFAFGTGKVGDLSGFTSAVVLAVVALLIGWESVQRLGSPVGIAFDEAILVAVIGLAVNLLSAWWLRDEDHGHDHGHDHDHEHGHADHDHAGHDHDHDHDHDHAGQHRDNNLRGAYLHVLADIMVSVLAIIGLFAGRQFGWVWMDPVMGLVGALVIARWSLTLMRDTGMVLLDGVADPRLATALRARLETPADHVTDLHLWRLGPGHNAAVIAIASDAPQPVGFYKARLAGLAGLSHVTVEVHRCPGAAESAVLADNSAQTYPQPEKP